MQGLACGLLYPGYGKHAACDRIVQVKGLAKGLAMDRQDKAQGDMQDGSVRVQGTRERILEQAEKLILERGYNATNLEDILQQAAITKSGFFYHFAGKNDLARALVARYLRNDELLFTGLWTRADALSEDPLQRMLLFLKLFTEVVQNLEHTHPGCLVVTFTYESHQQDEEVRDLVHEGVLAWRGMMLQRLNEILARRPLPEGISPLHLADMFSAVVEGGILLSRLYSSNEHLVQQVLLYRDYLRRLFAAV